MTPPFKSSPVEVNQHVLFPSNVFDLLPSDHECFLYRDLFAQLNTSAIESTYSRRGQHAYPPHLIVSILIYAYSRGVFSSRQIEQRCKEDLSFMYIAQLNCPNFRVLSDFRKAHGAFFQDCFKQTVQLAIELKLASLGHISLDGSKFKANTSKHKAMSYQRMKDKEQALSAEIDTLIAQASRCDEEEDQAYKERTGYELPEDLQHKQARLAQIQAAKAALEAREQARHPDQPIEGKKQISFADKDACPISQKGRFDYQYNVQLSVDEDFQIIVGQGLSDDANDKRALLPGLQTVKETTGQLPKKASIDNGYMSGTNLEALQGMDVEVYIATDRGEKPHQQPVDESDRALVKADFRYDPDRDGFICPADQRLELKRIRKDGRHFYQGDEATCEACPYQPRCCRSEKGHARTITTDDKEPLRQAMNEKMAEEPAKAIYARRKVIVEPVFGHIKNSGFRRFSVRGKTKVGGELSLVCIAHNLKKMAKAATQGLIRLEHGKLAKVSGI